MGGVIDQAASAIGQTQRRLEIIAQNISNATTAGYKRYISFAEIVDGPASNPYGLPEISAVVDGLQGKLISTGNPTDLAIEGRGYFQLHLAGKTIFSRQGQFVRDAEGRLVNADGYILQADGGGDVVTRSANFEIRRNGAVWEGGQAVGRIALFEPSTKELAFLHGGVAPGQATWDAVKDVSLKQGFLEASNVSTGDEMIKMMEVMRHAEAGQKLVTAYDDLMGRAITSFGENAR